MALVVRDNQNKALAVIQLTQKLDSSRFTEADAKHLKLVGDNLSQVFAYISQTDYLSQLSSKQ